MKEKIIYIVSFLLAFVFVTGVLIFLNSTYNNIFTFDFSTPVQNVAEIKKPDQNDSTKIQPEDSTIVNTEPPIILSPKVDSTLNKAATSAGLKDSNTVNLANKNIANEVKPALKIPPTVSEAPIQVAQAGKNLAKRDSLYKAWVKNIGKLYETMDTSKAAKIIQGY